MVRTLTGWDVFTEALNRLRVLYEEGHRIVVAFSGGKDSTCVLELARIAAAETGRLPVEVVMRDEEIMLPGTFEYAERIYHEPDIDMHWVYANQPIINAFNRESPFWWVFDPLLEPEQWVRQPPPFAYKIPELNIEHLVTAEKFPAPEGKETINVMGLRVAESARRLLGLHSSGGYLTKRNRVGVRAARPIYDWNDTDVWRAIRDNKWDYNSAYDAMVRDGRSPSMMRIAPPTMSAAGVKDLELARKTWPRWFDRVCERIPGLRTAAMFGKRALMPERRLGETWEQTYQRECIDEAPEWIRERAIKLREDVLRRHARHSTQPFPDQTRCSVCGSLSWRYMAIHMYSGDAFALKLPLPPVEPEFFRPGSGRWGGTPSFG